MRTRRVFLNRLDPIREPVDAVVVIDVLRSFSTAAYAFVAGAGTIYPVETIAAAFRLQRQLPDAVTTGAVGGGDPIPGFDFGNSPAELQHVHLAGRPLIQTTAAGVRGLTRFRHARALFAGSLVLARATASALLELQPAEVCFVITGEWVDRDGDEDVACADYIDALLQGEQPDPDHYAARVRESDFGRRFLADDNPHLPARDLHLCAQPDRFDFALAAAHVDGHLQLRRVRCALPGQSPAAGEVRHALRLRDTRGTPPTARTEGC